MQWCRRSRFVLWECSGTMKQCRLEWAALQKAVAHLTKRIQWDLKRESNAKSCESEWCAGQLQKRFKRWHELHWFTVSFSIRWYCFFCQITNTCLVLIVTLKIREYSNWKLKFIFAVVAVCVFALYAAYLLLKFNCISNYDRYILQKQNKNIFYYTKVRYISVTLPFLTFFSTLSARQILGKTYLPARVEGGGVTNYALLRH